MRRTRKRSTGHVGSTFLIVVSIIMIIMFFNHNKNQNNTILELSANISNMEKEIGQLKEIIKIQEETIEIVENSSTTEKTIAKNATTLENTTSYSSSIKHRDLRDFEDINVDQMNIWIDNFTKYNTQSPFRGQGEIFIKASQESGLDPRYILAHAALESAWGTSYLARTKHNYFGIAAYDNSPNSAYNMGNELEAGIVNGAKWIADNYTNQGQHTLYLMIYGRKKYASDAGWINKIENIMRNCNTDIV